MSTERGLIAVRKSPTSSKSASLVDLITDYRRMVTYALKRYEKKTPTESVQPLFSDMDTRQASFKDLKELNQHRERIASYHQYRAVIRLRDDVEHVREMLAKVRRRSSYSEKFILAVVRMVESASILRSAIHESLNHEKLGKKSRADSLGMAIQAACKRLAKRNKKVTRINVLNELRKMHTSRVKETRFIRCFDGRTIVHETGKTTTIDALSTRLNRLTKKYLR